MALRLRRAPLTPPPDPPGTHSHPGLRGLRGILIALTVAVSLSLAVGVLNAINGSARFEGIEDYLGIRREVAEDRSRSLEQQLDALACQLLAGRPSDAGGPDDQARARYGCPPAPRAAAPASVGSAPASPSPAALPGAPTASQGDP